MGITFSCAGWKAYSMIPTRLEYIQKQPASSGAIQSQRKW